MLGFFRRGDFANVRLDLDSIPTLNVDIYAIFN